MSANPPLPPTSPPLDYRPREDAGPRFLFTFLRWFVPFVGPAGVFIAVCTLVVPNFDQVFRDFGAKLPLATVALLRVSRLVCHGGWIAVIALALLGPLLIAALAPRDDNTPRRRILPTRLAWRASRYVMLAFIAFTAFALFQPMIALIEGISGKSH